MDDYTGRWARVVKKLPCRYPELLKSKNARAVVDYQVIRVHSSSDYREREDLALATESESASMSREDRTNEHTILEN
jgi:hypothetical protein